MADWGSRKRQMGTFPVNRENIRVCAGGFGNRLFTQKAGSRKFPSSIQPPGTLRSKRNNPLQKIGFVRILSASSDLLALSAVNSYENNYD